MQQRKRKWWLPAFHLVNCVNLLVMSTLNLANSHSIGLPGMTMRPALLAIFWLSVSLLVYMTALVAWPEDKD